MKRIVVVLGTRPEIIKLAPILREAKRRKLPLTLIHTNQHYSAELDAIFFTELELDAPTHNLHVGPGTQTQQTARMMVGIEEVLAAEASACIIVQGDTNSVLAGTLAASKMNVPIVHVEAGLRSYDRRMPEEVNRLITDHVSDLLFPPTEACAQTLRNEGIAAEKIVTAGNTVVDSVLENQEFIPEDTLSKLGLEAHSYFLLTLHRPSNVDTKEDLVEIIAALTEVAATTNTDFFFPAHPRTAGNIAKFGITLPKSIRLVEPVGYFQSLALIKNAKAVVTDSGGLQEEACILHVPCLTLRENTERPETVEVGANILIPRDATTIHASFKELSNRTWVNPLGDGTAAKQILDRIESEYANI